MRGMPHTPMPGSCPVHLTAPSLPELPLCDDLLAPPAELKSHPRLLQGMKDFRGLVRKHKKALVSHSTSKYVAYYWTDSQSLGRFPWWFDYTQHVTELPCACPEMSAGWDPWKSLNWFIQNTIKKNFSYKKLSLIAEDTRHKSEIALENIFCWNIKEGFVPEQKMVTKVETDKQDMSKRQQKRPSLTGAVLFHCTQTWRRTPSPVLTAGRAAVTLSPWGERPAGK